MSDQRESFMDRMERYVNLANDDPSGEQIAWVVITYCAILSILVVPPALIFMGSTLGQFLYFAFVILCSIAIVGPVLIGTLYASITIVIVVSGMLEAWSQDSKERRSHPEEY